MKLKISGQLKSGKNNMGISRERHYPLKAWAEWRDRVVGEIWTQYEGAPLGAQCRISVRYWAGDRRRRDVPGMEDALWHCLERAGVIADDKLFMETHFYSNYDKENPRAEVEIESLEG